MKKHIIFLLMIFISFTSRSQCNNYIIYESFTSTLPTQGGTWTANSMIAVTTPVRTGTHAIGFNGTGDWIRTPQISNPSILSFWYRRSANTTAWTLNIQTSPDGTTWTTRSTITTVTGTYTQYSLDLGSLGLTNVFIRFLDSRVSGAHERYIDDLSITSTISTQNTLIPVLSNCSQTLSSTLTYSLSDDGGPAGPISTGYGNSVDRTITLTPSDNTKKLQLSFTQMDLETTYDYLYVYDGPNTSSPLLATLNGTTIPSNIVATNSLGQLTIRWTTDISNVGTWGGFLASITSVSLSIPSCITSPTSPTNGATNISLTPTLSWPSTTYASNYDVYFGTTLPVTPTTNTTSTTYSPGTLIANTTYYWKIIPKNSSGSPVGCTSWSFTTLTPPINDNPNGAISLTLNTGTYSTYTNLYSTSTSVTTPSCASYTGEDVWFSLVVPSNGIVEIDMIQGVITDAGMSVYTGSIGSLTEIACDDDNSVNGLMPYLYLTSLSPGQTIYIRVWEYGGGTTGTFGILANSPVPLPVELISFDGVVYPGFNLIKWVTASEYNSDYFQIERSTDGETWKVVSTKTASGNSNTKVYYSYLDNISEFTINYYTLKQYDFDGQCKTYGPISLDNTKQFKKILKYVDIVGREVDNDTKGIVFELYEDGTMRKIIRY